MPGMSGGSGRVLLRRPEGHDPFIDVQPPPPGSSTMAARRGRSQTLAGPASSLSTPPPQQRQSGSGEGGSTSSGAISETPLSTQDSAPPPGQRMPPPIPDSVTEEFNGVNGRLNEAGKALTEAIKHINQGGKTGTAKKLVENILPLIQLAVRSIGRAEVAYGKEQEKAAAQPTPTDNVAIKLERLEKDVQEIKEAIKGQ